MVSCLEFEVLLESDFNGYCVQFCCFKTTLGRFISSLQAWITWFWVRMVIWQNLCVEKLRFGEDFEKSSNCSYSWCFLMVFNLLKDYPKMLGLLVETLESNFEFESMIKWGFNWEKCNLMMNMTKWLILIYLLMLMNNRSMLRLEED